MSQPPPYGPPPGIPQPYPSPRPRRPGFWARRGLLGKVSVVIGGVLGAFVVLAVLISAFVPDTPAMIAAKTAKAEARATGNITTATAKEDGRMTATAIAVAAKQGTQDARTTSTAMVVVAKQSTQDTQIRATANAPTGTAKPVPTEKPTGTPKPAPTTAATPIPTAPATATSPAPQVVTVKGEPVNLRQAADGGSAVVVLVPPGTDATVLGADTTGPDGVTRYVHARVGDKEGYLRSDLVSVPHTAADTSVAPNPTPSATQAQPAFTGIDALGRCMYQGFGGGGDPRYATSWYGNIVGYRMVGTRIEVDTNLFFKDSNKQVATNMRSAVIGCVFSERIGGNWVAVHSVNNTGVLAGGAIPGR